MIESGDEEIPHQATALDLSPHGVRIAAQATLTPGQTLSLIQPDDPAHTLRCLVVWTGDVSADGQEQAGLEFLDVQPQILEN
jgi:PilZ domain